MEKVWLRNYPAGIPPDLPEFPYRSLADLVGEACRNHPRRTAYISMGRQLSYAELDRLSRDFAAWLQGLGVKKGDRVAVMLPNVLQYPVCMFGALRAGAVIVNCNPLYTAEEIEHQLKDSGATVIVVLENFAHTVEAAAARTDLRHIVVTSLGELLGPVRGRLTDFVVRHVKRMVPPWRIEGSSTLCRALKTGSGTGFSPPALERDDLAFLQYTGGTTGVAKGAMLSHGNLLANVVQAYTWISPLLHTENELVVTAIPLYHVFALTANCLTFVRAGAANLLIANPRDIPGFIKELGRHRFTALTGVNTLFNALLHNPDFARLDFTHLHLTLGGGMAVQQAVADRWQSVTGKPLSQAYGLTETSPAVTINPLDKPYSSSIGLPIPSTGISIRNDSGQELALGEVGELCVRGPQVMKGYWQRPDETAKVMMADGFLRTGDLGYVDEHGYVYLVDRKKDMILVSGFKVYPNEVEEILAAHPGVLEAAVLGVPDERSGEVVKAFVVRRDPMLTAESVIAHCRQHLAAYKVPKHVEFRDTLPKTNVGKILRRALKEGN